MKGQTYMIEAIIAIGVIAIFFFSIFFFTPIYPEFSEFNYKIQILDSLKAMDDLNLLRPAVYSLNTNLIESFLRKTLPSNLNFKVVIYDKDKALTQEVQTVSPFVFSVSYYIAGNYGRFGPREVRVYVWGYK